MNRRIAEKQKWSYTSDSKLGILSRISELVELTKTHLEEDPTKRCIGLMKSMQQRVRKHTESQFDGMNMLDIGPGQYLELMHCFSKNNTVEGVDMDYILQGLDLRQIANMLKYNSALRAIKTLGRKALLIDTRFKRKIARELELKKIKTHTIHRMNATKLDLHDNTYDCVYSIATFQHIDEPEKALEEIVRVTKEGGVVYISLQLYTNHSGCHVPGLELEPPFWPHLREQYADSIQSTAYLNKLSLSEWYQVANKHMPNATIVLEQQKRLADALDEIQQDGELIKYNKDELITINVVFIWQKGVQNRSKTERVWV